MYLLYSQLITTHKKNTFYLFIFSETEAEQKVQNLKSESGEKPK